MFLYFYISTYCSTCAVPNVPLFSNFLNLCFPSMLLRYCLSDFEMVPVATISTGITLVSTYHMCCIFIVMFLSLNLHSFFLHAILAPGIATSINMHVPLSLSHIMMSGLLPVCTVGSTIQLPYLQDFFRLISVHGHTGVCCLIFLLFPSICYSAVQHTLYHVSLCTVILPVPGVLI